MILAFNSPCSTQAGSHPITSISWLPTLRLLVTVSKDGTLQVWKTRVIVNPNRQPMQANFFEHAGSQSFFCECNCCILLFVENQIVLALLDQVACFACHI